MKKIITLFSVIALLISGCTFSNTESSEQNTITNEVSGIESPQTIIIRSLSNPEDVNFEYRKINRASNSSELFVPVGHNIIYDETRPRPGNQNLLIQNEDRLYIKNIQTNKETDINLQGYDLSPQDVVTQNVHLVQDNQFYFMVSAIDNLTGASELKHEFVFNLENKSLEKVTIKNNLPSDTELDAIDLDRGIALGNRNKAGLQEIVLYSINEKKEIALEENNDELEVISGEYFSQELNHILLKDRDNQIYQYAFNDNTYSFVRKINIPDDICSQSQCRPNIAWGADNKVLINNGNESVFISLESEDGQIAIKSESSIFSSDEFATNDVFLLNKDRIIYSEGKKVNSLNSSSEVNTIYQSEDSIIHIVAIN